MWKTLFIFLTFVFLNYAYAEITTIDFGNVDLTSTTPNAQKTIKLKNQGTKKATSIEVTANSSFSKVNDTCSNGIDSSQTCEAIIKYAPTKVENPVNGSITIQYDNGNIPNASKTVTLTGLATCPTTNGYYTDADGTCKNNPVAGPGALSEFIEMVPYDFPNTTDGRMRLSEVKQTFKATSGGLAKSITVWVKRYGYIEKTPLYYDEATSSVVTMQSVLYSDSGATLARGDLNVDFNKLSESDWTPIKINLSPIDGITKSLTGIVLGKFYNIGILGLFNSSSQLHNSINPYIEMRVSTNSPVDNNHLLIRTGYKYDTTVFTDWVLGKQLNIGIELDKETPVISYPNQFASEINSSKKLILNGYNFTVNSIAAINNTNIPIKLLSSNILELDLSKQNTIGTTSIQIYNNPTPTTYPYTFIKSCQKSGTGFVNYQPMLLSKEVANTNVSLRQLLPAGTFGSGSPKAIGFWVKRKGYVWSNIVFTASIGTLNLNNTLTSLFSGTKTIAYMTLNASDWNYVLVPISGTVTFSDTQNYFVNIVHSAGASGNLMYPLIGIQGKSIDLYNAAGTTKTATIANQQVPIGIDFDCTTTVNTNSLPDTIQPSVSFERPALNTRVADKITIEGPCEEGLPVNITGNIVETNLTANCANGNFNKEITLSGVDGNKSITITQVDASGNTGSDSRVFIKDTTPPVTTISSLTPVYDGAVLRWSTNESVKLLIEYKNSNDAQFSSLPMVSNSFRGVNKYAIKSLNENTSYELKITSTDSAGNQSTFNQNFTTTTLDYTYKRISSTNDWLTSNGYGKIAVTQDGTKVFFSKSMSIYKLENGTSSLFTNVGAYINDMDTDSSGNLYVVASYWPSGQPAILKKFKIDSAKNITTLSLGSSSFNYGIVSDNLNVYTVGQTSGDSWTDQYLYKDGVSSLRGIAKPLGKNLNTNSIIYFQCAVYSSSYSWIHDNCSIRDTLDKTVSFSHSNLSMYGIEDVTGDSAGNIFYTMTSYYNRIKYYNKFLKTESEIGWQSEYTDGEGIINRYNYNNEGPIGQLYRFIISNPKGITSDKYGRIYFVNVPTFNGSPLPYNTMDIYMLTPTLPTVSIDIGPRYNSIINSTSVHFEVSSLQTDSIFYCRNIEESLFVTQSERQQAPGSITCSAATDFNNLISGKTYVFGVSAKSANGKWGPEIIRKYTIQ